MIYKMNEKCKHCGADYGLHHGYTNQCPAGGVEAIHGRQQWDETTFDPGKTYKELQYEIARLQGREKELMELLNDARGHLVLNPSYPSKQVVIGKIDALLSRYSGEQQKENV